MTVLTRRATPLLMAIAFLIPLATAGVARANDVGVLRAVVSGAKKTTAPAVGRAITKIENDLNSHNAGAVIKPLGVFIKAYRAAVGLVRPTHGSSATGRKLKADALAGFNDYLKGALTLRTSAHDWLIGDKSESNHLVLAYNKDNSEGAAKLKAAAKAERALLK